MYALIQKSDNSILKISEYYSELSSKKPFYWIACPTGTATDWKFDGYNFIKPVVTNQQPITEPVTSEPQEIIVSPWQIRQALNELGLRNQVEELVKSTTDQNIKDGWEFATEWREFNPFVQLLGNKLNLTKSQIHVIFVLAKEK